MYVCMHVCMNVRSVCTVQLNLNFTHAYRYTSVLAHLMHANFQKLECAQTVACDFGVYMQDSKHT